MRKQSLISRYAALAILSVSILLMTGCGDTVEDKSKMSVQLQTEQTEDAASEDGNASESTEGSEATEDGMVTEDSQAAGDDSEEAEADGENIIEYAILEENQFQVGDLIYTINKDEKTVKLTYDQGSAEVVEVPAKVQNEGDGKTYRVTDISTDCFTAHEEITEVVLPDTVTKLEDEVFVNCTSLKKVTLPKNLTVLPSGTFFGCDALEEIVFPEKLKVIEAEAFTNCSSLVSLTLPDSLVEIGDEAFWACYGIEELTIPAHVTKLGDRVFYDCCYMTTLHLPDSLKQMDEGMLEYCDSLENIYVSADQVERFKTLLPGRSEIIKGE